MAYFVFKIMTSRKYEERRGRHVGGTFEGAVLDH
jgi:hypothetical protein